MTTVFTAAQVIPGERICCVHFAIQRRNVAMENQSGMIMKAILNTVNAIVRHLAVTRLQILTLGIPTRYAHVTQVKIAAREILGQIIKIAPASPDLVNAAQVKLSKLIQLARVNLKNSVALDKHGKLM